MTRPPSPFGAYLKTLRKQRGLTQEALSAKAGVGLSVIKWTETGRTSVPDPANVEALVRAVTNSKQEADELRDAARRSSTDQRLEAMKADLSRLEDAVDRILRHLGIE